MQHETPSIRVILGLLLLPGGTYSNTFLGNLSSVILFTWPYHFNCLFLMKSIIEF